jgi:hypothetical protein
MTAATNYRHCPKICLCSENQKYKPEIIGEARERRYFGKTTKTKRGQRWKGEELEDI